MSSSPSFDWTLFLELGRKLVQPPPTPARLRSGIGRAYYAAYNKALRFLEARNEPVPEGPGRHQKLWLSFKRDGDPKRKSVGNVGEGLMKDRHSADYDDEFTGNLIRQAGLAIEKAETVLDYLEYLASSP